MTRFFMALLIFCTLCIKALAIPAGQAPAGWYEEIPIRVDHDNNPDLNFLMGTWRSIDPKQPILTETWSRSADDMPLSVRTRSLDSAKLEDYSVIVLFRTPVGARLSMHRLSTNRHRAMNPEHLDGVVEIPTRHRAIIRCESDSLEITSKYDCPRSDLLNIEVTSKQNGIISKEVFHLKKQSV